MSFKPEPVTVLVHPGSLCGSYESYHDYHPDWQQFAREQRRINCDSFVESSGARLVVLGTDLDDEIPHYPTVQQAVQAATDTFYADAVGKALEKAADAIWEKYGRRAASILVTGAWCDSPDGCAWTIFQRLQVRAQNTGISVELDREGAYESDIDELPSLEDEDE